MLRPAASLVLLLTVACGGGGSSDRTVTVGGDRVSVARLVDAHAALCEAAARPDTARTLFFDRSHEALHTVARGLEDVDRAQAAELLEAKEKVEADLAAPGGSLPADLSRLADVYRASLGRLAITAPPCD
ncbi:MAG: hypothetical protein M3326_07290 [Actinomycetota bacterium]|nr:hypothetical protein [Actinomycetota bacterium]